MHRYVSRHFEEEYGGRVYWEISKAVGDVDDGGVLYRKYVEPVRHAEGVYESDEEGELSDGEGTIAFISYSVKEMIEGSMVEVMSFAFEHGEKWFNGGFLDGMVGQARFLFGTGLETIDLWPVSRCGRVNCLVATLRLLKCGEVTERRIADLKSKPCAVSSFPEDVLGLEYDIMLSVPFVMEIYVDR